MGLHGMTRCAECNSPSRGVRIGGGYDLLQAHSKSECAQETVRADSPYRTDPVFAHGAPSQTSGADRYSVGSYTSTAPLGVPLRDSIGSLAMDSAIHNAALSHQLYRVMVPANRGSSRPSSATRSLEKRSSSNQPSQEGSFGTQQSFQNRNAQLSRQGDEEAAMENGRGPQV